MASSTFLVLAPLHRASFLQERNPLLGAQAFSSRRSLGQSRTLQKKIDLHAPSPTLLREKSLIVESTSGRNVKTAKDTIVLDPDYRLPVILLGSAAALIYTDNLLPAAPIGLLGLLLLFQTTRVKFLFDGEALEVKIGDQLQESGENVFVGGKNRWKYSTFVNWELWWPTFPVLVYFKETQTKPEGQVHFFPVIFNGKQLYDVMVERAGTSKNSAPK